MTDTTYEGWKNWETWNMALWIDNEEPRYKRKVKLLKKLTPETLTAGRVEAFCRHEFPVGTPDMAGKGRADRLNAVDFEEIAESWRAEIEEIKRYQ